MAKRGKTGRSMKRQPIPPSLPAALNATQLKVKNPGLASHVAYQGLLGYGEVAFGDKQHNSSAPLAVPAGFATQIPYNSAINSTIIQNPSAIPVATFFQILVSDPIVYSCMLYMITTIIARIGEYTNADKECEKIVRDSLKRVGKIKLCQALLTSLWAGFAALKLNWDYIDGYTTIKNILVLPPDSILLAVTPEGELDDEFGVMQYYYNMNSGWQQNGKAFSSIGNAPYAAFGSFMSPQRQVSFNPMFLSAFPKEWRIFHTFNPIGLAGNWYGTSMIQPIFRSIADKNNIQFKIQIAATYKAAPMVVALCDTQTQVEIEEGGATISMSENLKRTWATGAQTGFYFVDGKDAVDFTTLDNTANLEQMGSLIDRYNSEIHAGLCTPDLVGNSGSYANAMANNQSNEEIINNLTLHVIDTIENQFVKPNLDFAIGEDQVEDYGHFELLDNSLNDKAIWAKILESSKELGVIRPKEIDDFNFIRKKLGFTPVDEIDDDIVYGMMGLFNDSDPMERSNFAKTKESIKAPYSGGLDKKQNNRYDKAA